MNQVHKNEAFSAFNFTIGLLGVLFVGLKLTGYIDWSWWWVTLPFWGGYAIFLALVVLAAITTIFVGTYWYFKHDFRK